MKATKSAYIILCTLILLVSLNTYMLCRTVSHFEERINEPNIQIMDTLALEYEKIYSDFGKAEMFLGITVSHNDLTNAEELFAELIGAARAKDYEGVIIAKSRLSDALLHLRRLVGFNIESIL